jgi:2'-5' RNA ligase
MRLFIGIPLATSASQEVAALLTHARSTLREPQIEQLRWSAPEAWHITLQFLGKTTPEQYACVVERLRDVHHPPVPVELSSVATFERTGVFFAGVQLSPELLTLHQAIVAATYPCGFRTEDHPYRPHVTLARRRRSATSLEWRAVTSGAHPPLRSSFTADSFVLYESIPSPEGSRYVQRAQFALQRSG